MSLEQPTRAFHGTPHRFEKFDVNAIGTGEGAAAYGWGFYCASSRATARYYSGDENCAGAFVPTIFEIGGVRTVQGTAQQKAADLIESAGLKRAREIASEMLGDAKNGHEWTHAKGLQYYAEINEIVHTIKRASEVRRSPGAIYHLAIPASGLLLDWHLAAREQPGPIRDALVRLGFQDSALHGEQVYRNLVRDIGSAKQASNRLLEAGLQGITYFGDAQSAAECSRNYVVFNPDAITIDAVEIAGKVRKIGTSRRVSRNSDSETMRVRAGDALALIEASCSSKPASRKNP